MEDQQQLPIIQEEKQQSSFEQDDEQQPSSSDDANMHQFNELVFTNSKFKDVVNFNPNWLKSYNSKPIVQSVEPIPPKIETETIVTQENLVTLIMEQLMSTLGTKLGSKTALIASIMASGAISITSGITTLILTPNPGKAIKILITAQLVTSFTSIVHAIYVVCEEIKVAYDKVKVLAQLPDFVAKITPTILSNACPSIVASVTSIISVVLSGLCAISVIDMSDVIKHGNYLRSLGTVNTTVKDSMNFILEDICELDLTGDATLHRDVLQLAHRSAEMARLPYWRFISDAQLRKELMDFQGLVIKTTSKPFSKPKLSVTLRQAQQLLNNNISTLQLKIDAVNTVVNSKRRQETLGVYFSGEAGHGKSTLCTRMMNDVANIMSYKKGLYNLNTVRADGYYEPYGCQDFAALHEFMATRCDDPNIDKLNGIISSDAFNLESAHLEGKNQPAMFKLVFITANNLNPNLIPKMTEGAIQGFWDRIVRYEMHDPNYEGRQSANAHRKPDLSHLKFWKVTKGTEIDAKKIDKSLKETNYRAMVRETCIVLAQRELSFIQEHGTNDLLLKEAASVEEMELRKQHLNRIIQGNIANSEDEGQVFRVIRFQGPPKTGKTKLAKQLISYVTSTYLHLKSYKVKDFSETPTKPGVYLIDDILEQSKTSLKSYLDWINEGHPDNWYIIVSNHIVPRKKTGYWGFRQESFIANFEGLSSGLVRRFGLYGSVKLDKDYYYNSSSTQITVNTNHSCDVYINGNQFHNGEIVPTLVRFMSVAIEQSPLIKIVRESYTTTGDEEWDVDLDVGKIEDMAPCFTSYSNILIAHLMGYKSVGLKLTPRFREMMERERNNALKMIPQTVAVDGTSIQHYFESICNRLGDFIYGVRVRLRVQDANLTYHFLNNTIYLGNTFARLIPVRYIPSTYTIQVQENGRIYDISLQDYSRFKMGGSRSDSLKEISLEGIQAIHIAMGNLGDSQSAMLNYWNHCYKVRNHIDRLKQDPFKYFKDEKIITIIGSLTALLTAGGVIYGIYRLCAGKDATETKSNSSTDEDEDDDPRRAELENKMRAACFKSKEARDAVLNEAQRYGGAKMKQHISDYEWEIRGNSIMSEYKDADNTACKMILDAVKNKDIETFMTWTSMYPNMLMSIVEQGLPTVANMLTLKEVADQKPTIINLWMAKLQRNYVRLEGVGTVFGLGLKERYIVTVSHAFKDVGDRVKIMSNGITYEGTVLGIQRSRDIAIIRGDSQLPQFSDITSNLGTSEDYHKISTGWFLRPVPNNSTAYAARLDYIPRLVNAKEDPTNPYYALQDRVWKYSLIGLEDMTKVFSLGDCGLPLLGLCKNRMVILGVHNGLTNAGHTWFSSFSVSDLDHCLEHDIVANGIHMHLCKWCNKFYKHNHNYRYEQHKQFPSQCPYQDCPQYHGGNNPTKSYQIQSVLANSGEVVKRPVTHVTMNHMLAGDKPFIMDKAMHNILQSEQAWQKSKYEGMSDLNLIGYNSLMHVYSKPVLKKIYLPYAESHLTCASLPSAITLENVTDFKDLVKDRHGNYDTLFTQAVKFKQRTATFGQWDKDIDNHVNELLKQYFQLKYPDNSELDLNSVINGYGLVKPIEMETSAGIKMKLIYKVHSKRPKGNEDVLFKNLNADNPMKKPYYVINAKDSEAAKALKNDYYAILNAWKEGKPYMSIIKDNPKAELLPKAKVAVGKVRMFNELNVADNMAYKAIFGTLLNQMFALHETEIYCVGMNPYLDATAHMLQFDAMDGEFIDTDCKTLDKTIPRKLIEDFVETHFRESRSEAFKKAVTDTLCYRIHVMNGNIYFVDSGNDSGQFITTILNCFVIHKTTWYTIVRKYYEKYGRFPSLQEVMYICILKALGDDALRKLLTMYGITIEDLTKDAALYNIILTPPKNAADESIDAISFCSRTYEKLLPNIYVPKLKKESVTNCLFYFSSTDKRIVQQNCFIAALEASFHERDFFNKVIGAINSIAKEMGISCPDYFTYDQYRAHFAEYVRGAKNSPVGTLALFENKSEEISNSLQKEANQTYVNFTNQYVKQMADMYINEYVQKHELDTPEFVYSRDGDAHTPTWTCSATLKAVDGNKYSTRGTAPTKTEAKRGACERLRSIINETTTANSAPKRETNPFRTVGSFSTSVEDGIATVDVSLKFKPNELRKLEEILKLVKDIDICRSNMDSSTPVEPSQAAGAMRIQQMAELPSQANPQPTGVVPAMTSPGEDTMAALEGVQRQTLNTIGAPNMLSVGAIGFDIKSLVYEQFLDADTQFELTSDAPAGSVLLQVPYGINHPYLNQYIKQYAALHERYSGAIQYRFTLVGNPLFSGAIGIAWYPRAITTSTVSISEMQKYSYSAKGLTLPWNVVHTLHDARREFFYRLTDETPTELLDRPHLVIFTLITLQNPLKEGAMARLRIASKLANGIEPNPFMLANPTIPPEVASNALAYNSPAFNGASFRFNDTFLNVMNQRIWIYTDGLIAGSESYDDERYYPNWELTNYRTQGNTRSQRYASGQGISNSYASNEQPRTSWVTIIPEYISFLPSDFNNGIQEIYAFGNLPDKYMTSFLLSLPISQYFTGVSSMFMPSSQFNQCKVYANLNQTHLTSLKIISATHTSTPFEVYSVVPPGEVSPAYESFYVLDQIKYVTNQGTVTLYSTILISSVDVNARHLGPRSLVTTEFPTDPFLNVELQTTFLAPTAVVLPTGYNLLRMTEMSPSAISIVDFINPTATDNSIVQRYFQNLARDLPLTKVLQFTLLDTISVRNIAIVRYLQEYGIFVVNTESINPSKVMPYSTSQIAISNLGVVERTNEFVTTNVFTWFSRTSSDFIRNNKVYESPIDVTNPVSYFKVVPEEPVRANASMLLGLGGGMMQGIGQGMQNMQNQKHELLKQSKQFEHEEGMQGNMFNFNKEMQANQFDFTKMMGETNYGYDQGLSRLRASEERTTNRENANNQLLNRGMSSRLMSLPGSTLSSNTF
jgi:hypothetical protein